MKTSHILLAMLAASTVLSGTVVAQDNTPGAIKEYLPYDGSTVKQGAVVRIVHDESFVALQKEAAERFAKLPAEKQKAIAEKADPSMLMEYTADLWPNKADYEKYVAAWKKIQIAPAADVALGFDPAGDGKYRVLSATRVNGNAMMPITIGALTYDSKTDTWTSANGELKGKKFEVGDRFAFGAQTGTEWVYEKKDSLSTIKEVVRFTKTTDGKFHYIYYSLVEISSVNNQPIANHGYLMRFPVVTPSAATSKPGQK